MLWKLTGERPEPEDEQRLAVGRSAGPEWVWNDAFWLQQGKLRGDQAGRRALRGGGTGVLRDPEAPAAPPRAKHRVTAVHNVQVLVR